MHDDPIILFMIQIVVVLAAARILGEVFRRFKQPPLAGEILAGILLGQTVLGRLAPDVFGALFPDIPLQRAMYGVLADIGILFLLLAVGLEVHVASAWKMRNQTFVVAMSGVVVPLALGTGTAWMLYPHWVEVPAPRLAFSLLVGAGVSITAITVVARVLFDLRIIKSDLGLFLVSAMALNELLGWIVLAVVLGLVGAGVQGSGFMALSNAMNLAGTLAGILLFAGFALTLGRTLTTRALLWMARQGLPSPAAPLSLVVCLGLLGGVITGSLGVHPVFGFLLAGMMAGDPQALSEHTRSVIGQMVEAIFVPLFFAGICLNIDFAVRFDVWTVLAVTLLSVVGKFLGAWLGTLKVDLPAADRLPVAIAHIPGGPMGVLLASVAKEAGVIGPKMFVALVVASIVSALLVGPAFAWALRRRRTLDVLEFFSSERIVWDLGAETRTDAISVLARCVGEAPGAPDADGLLAAVLAREHSMGTGLGEGIAVPHARLAGLVRPLVVFGIAREGIDWDAVDGKPAHLIFLILTPHDENDTQLQILAAIVKALSESEVRHRLLEARGREELWEGLEQALAPLARPGAFR